jgi:hypothetical protein
MSAVLVTVMNGAKVLDSGTGIVLAHHAEERKTYVLTCAHTIRALGRRVVAAEDNPVRLVVNGAPASDNDDPRLARLDLAVLTAHGLVGTPARLKVAPPSTAQVRCEGFTGFFQHQFARREVRGKVQRRLETVMPDGTALTYLEVKPGPKSERFAKGLSGAPVFDGSKCAIGVARILEGSKDGDSLGYAIQFSPAVIALVQEKVPGAIAGAGADPEGPPQPPPPTPEGLKRDDIQKGRWKGQSDGFGRRTFVANVRRFKRYFMFDAGLEATDGRPLQGPFVFHLHDTFAKCVIWIRKTNGVTAVLEEIEATGTFTWAVQFKDGDGHWQGLEYDLEDYDGGRLKSYD